jgi:hypothetical protein
LNLVYRSLLLRVVFFFALVSLVLSPPILSTGAVTSYLPNVNLGQFAQYKVLKDSCHSSISSVCQSFGTSLNSLNDTTYDAVQVLGVSGPAVTLQLISIFKNGTGAHTGALVNVATGASNITAFSLGARDYFLLAGGLAAPEQLWSTLSAPTFNKTINEMVLGSPRNVNFLNYSAPGSYLGVSYLEHVGFAFDQSSGFLIGINFSLRTVNTGIAKVDFAITMVDNNVWRNAHMPDFDLSAYPTSVNTVENTSGNSTITLHRLYGFSATVKLSVTASDSGISCSFSANSLQNGGSDTSTLSCRGSPGTYTVRVEGNGGYSVHNTSITFTVSAAPSSPQPASILSMPLFYGGIGIAAVAGALAAFLFLRRKPSRAMITQGDTSPGATQA